MARFGGGWGSLAERIKGRAEGRHISDPQGGLLVDFRLILAQTTAIVLLLLVDVGGTALFLWGLPSWLWWVIITTAYALGVACAFVWALRRRGAWLSAITARFDRERGGQPLEGQPWWGPTLWRVRLIRVAILLGVAPIYIGPVLIYYLYIWDWLDAWTRDFFRMRVPVFDGWLLLAAIGPIMAVAILRWEKKAWKAALIMLATSLPGWYFVMTREWTEPTLMFYLVELLVLACLWSGTVWAIIRFIHEVRDVYEPDQAPEDPSPRDALAGWKEPAMTSRKQGGGKHIDL